MFNFRADRLTMDEAEWQACTDPRPMLDFLGRPGRDRKLRLFAAACCRHIGDLITDPRSWLAVEVAERIADGTATAEEVARTKSLALAAAQQADEREYEEEFSDKHTEAALQRWATGAALCTLTGYVAWCEKAREQFPALRSLVIEHGATWNAFAAAANGADLGMGPQARQQDHNEAEYAEMRYQTKLLREIIGNPFQPINLDPAWLSWHGGAVVKVAQAAYEERHLPAGTLDQTRLAVLADALEEAGCADGQILGHLRSGEEHYRGCFVVDACLGKV